MEIANPKADQRSTKNLDGDEKCGNWRQTAVDLRPGIRHLQFNATDLSEEIQFIGDEANA